MSDLSLFEESLLKDPKQGGYLLVRICVREGGDEEGAGLLRDSTPFQMAASVSILLYLCWLFLFSVLDTTTAADEHF